MKKLTFSEFDKYTYTDNEYIIREINDWKFAELQDYHGNRIKKVVISEKTKYYRKKTKSEFYNKVAYNHKGGSTMTNKIFILKTSEDIEVFTDLAQAIAQGNNMRNLGLAKCKVYAFNNEDLNNAYKVYECLSEEEEEDLTQQIIDNVIDDFFQGLDNDFDSKFEKTAYFDLGYEESMIEDIKERILERLQGGYRYEEVIHRRYD